MPILSLLRWRSYCVRSAQRRFVPSRRVQLQLKSPINAAITVRESASDEQTFFEVLVEEVYKPVVGILPDNARIIDLGANIGLATLYLTHHAPSSQVMAVEPNPETFAILNINLQPLITAGRCKTLQAAAWREESNLILDDHGSPEQFNMYSVRERLSDTDGGLRVRGRTILRIVQDSGFDTVDLLKIDVEGAESGLFEGDLSWMARIRAMAVEFHGDSRRASDFDRIIKCYGFRVYEHPHTIIAVREHGPVQN